MSKTLKDVLIIVTVTLGLTLLMWLPHLLALHSFFNLDFSNGFATIYRNFDGLEYVVIAKSLYNPNLIAQLPQSLAASYYASHFPGYALAILAFAPFLGFLKSMLLVSVLSTIAAAIAFYFLVKNFHLTMNPLPLTIIFLILPARWLIIHSVGASEPLFIFLCIMTIYFFMKFEEKMQTQFILIASLFALLAQITRPPGLLLLISLAIYIHWKYFFATKLKDFQKNILTHLKYSPIGLAILGLLLVFWLFQQNYGDFFAYFHSGDNIHLTFPPFQVFDKYQFWVGDIWLEDIIYIFIIGFSGGLMLWKKKLYPMAFFVLTYLIAATLVVHRDISRYTLPIFPFVLIAFEKFLTSKEFKIVLAVVALGIYLYAQNFLIQNVAPVPNLAAFN